METVSCFTGDMHFLSNFHEAPVTYEGITYPSVENAFQAQKSLTDRKRFTDITSAAAKKLGKRVVLRTDWESVKLSIMHDLVFAKFTQNPELKQKLLATENATLIEGNCWHDTFWGVCDGIGKNHLGNILMQVRNEIKE